MHFTTLGYSRPDGQTSDNWLNVRQLVWEPEFYRYVRDAFAPVGLMIDAWAEEYESGKKQDFPVAVINDLNEPWNGDIRFRLLQNGKTVTEQKLPVDVAGLGSSRLVFTVVIPEQSGNYQAEAALIGTTVGPVRSLRDLTVRH